MKVLHIHPDPVPLVRYLNPWRVAREMWAARTILVHFGRKEVSQRYRGARLGSLWAFLHPLFLLLVYTIAFGVFLKTKWPESPREGLGEVALAVYCGLTVFGMFSEAANRAPLLLVENSNYVKRTQFPIQMLPFCVVSSAAFHALINLVILVVLGWVVGGFHAPAMLAPLILVPLIFLSAAASLVLAVLGPVFRDLRHVIEPVLRALMFMTPTFYSPSLVPAKLSWLIDANPLAFVMGGVRRLVLWQGTMDWRLWGIWTVICLGLMILAYALFMRLKSQVADVV